MYFSTFCVTVDSSLSFSLPFSFPARPTAALDATFEGGHASDKHSVSSSDFQQLSLLYNECSLSAIANWTKGGHATKDYSPDQKVGKADTRTYHYPVAGSMFHMCNQCNLWGHYDSECTEIQAEETIHLAESTRVQQSLCQFVREETSNRSRPGRRPLVHATSVLQLSQNEDDKTTRDASSSSHREHHTLTRSPQKSRSSIEAGKSKNAIKSNMCEICNSAYKADDLLLCDGCDLLFHMQCLNPPIQHVPDCDWFCEKCQSYDSDVSSVVELEACDGFVIEQRRRGGNELNTVKEEESKGLGFTDGSWSVALGVVPRETLTSITSDIVAIDQTNESEAEATSDEDPDNIPDLAMGELCWAKRGSAHMGMLGRDEYWPAMVVVVDPSSTKNRIPYHVKFFSLIGAHCIRPTEVLPFYKHYEEIAKPRLSDKNMNGYDSYRSALNAAVAEVGFTSLGQVLKRAREIKNDSGNKSLEKHHINCRFGYVGSSRGRPSGWEGADSTTVDGIEILARSAQGGVARVNSSLPTPSKNIPISGKKRSGDDDVVFVEAHSSYGKTNGDGSEFKRRRVDEPATSGTMPSADTLDLNDLPTISKLSPEQLLGGLVAWVGAADSSITADESNNEKINTLAVPELHVGIGCFLDDESGKLLVRTLVGLDDILVPGQISTRRSRSRRAASRPHLSAEASAILPASMPPKLQLHSIEFGASLWVPVESCLLLDAAPKTTIYNFSAPSGKLGLSFVDKKNAEGAIVSRIRASSSLISRISPGDSIVAINGEDVSKMTAAEMKAALSLTAQGERTLTVIGGGHVAVQQRRGMKFCQEWLATTLNAAKNDAAQLERMAADEREERMIELDRTGMITRKGSPTRQNMCSPSRQNERLPVDAPLVTAAVEPTANRTSNTNEVEEKIQGRTMASGAEPKEVVDNKPEANSQLSDSATAPPELEAAGATDDTAVEVEGEVHLGDGIYEAERILDEKTRSSRQGATHFLVKWKGTDETTWEPARNILNQNLVSIFYATRAATKLRKTGEAKDPSSFTSKMIALLDKGEKILKANIHNPSSPRKKRRICPFCRQHFREASSFSGHVRLHSAVENYKTIKECSKIIESDWFD